MGPKTELINKPQHPRATNCMNELVARVESVHFRYVSSGTSELQAPAGIRYFHQYNLHCFV